MSSRPSRLKSARTRATGDSPTGTSMLGGDGVPRRTMVMLLSPVLATTRSRSPSPSTSPRASPIGVGPTGYDTGVPDTPPTPLARATEQLLVWLKEIAASSKASVSRWPSTTSEGFEASVVQTELPKALGPDPPVPRRVHIWFEVSQTT